MRPARVRHLVLVGVGAVLVGSGLALVRTAPRADAPDIGPPGAAAEGSPGVVAPAGSVAAPTQPPPVMPPPVSVSLPGTPRPVPLVPVGVLDSGALQLPERPTVLGWYAAGAVPGGTVGTAVIAGHVDSARYGAGPLRDLLDVGQGDPVEVTDAGGSVHRYAVTSRTSFPKSALPPELFHMDGPPRLALITCGGAFDRRTGNYADNVVVLADPVP